MFAACTVFSSKQATVKVNVAAQLASDARQPNIHDRSIRLDMFGLYLELVSTHSADQDVSCLCHLGKVTGLGVAYRHSSIAVEKEIGQWSSDQSGPVDYDRTM